MSYLFGDSVTAQSRLDILARTFEPPTQEFLSTFTPRGKALALDLGCGPGHTTRLIAESLPFKRVVGLDKSPNFIDAASGAGSDQVSYLQHDVSVTPFPVSPADLIFCRFLITHLPTPDRALAKWASQLSPSGALLLEEVHWIHTRNPVLESYLSALDRVMDATGVALYAGARLPELINGTPLKITADNTRHHPVTNRDAAAMFSMNLRSWGTSHPAISLYGSAFLCSLRGDLEEMTVDSPDTLSEIQWGMRQMVLEPS